MKVAVVSPRTTTPMDQEVAAMVADVLTAAGHVPWCGGDGDPACLDADVALLVGDCLEFDATLTLLRGHRAARPRTVLWQLHALPPPDLSDTVARQGQRVGDALHRLQSGRRMGRLLVAARNRIPPKLRVTIRSALYGAVRRAASDDPTLRRWNTDEASRQFMLMRYGWLQRRLPEGTIDVLAMSTAPRVEFLKARGVASVHVPFGSHPTLGRDLAVERDLDVVFLGRAKIRRRERLLRRLRDALRQRGRRLHTVEGRCFGEARTRILNRARISLSLSNYPWEVPGIRFVMSMSCGALVISEPIGDATPFRVGEHFLAASAADLEALILRTLDAEPGRARLADTARRFVTAQLTLRDSVTTLLQRAGAPVEVPS